MATNPMHQFNVHKIGPEIKINGIDLSFTNASLFMLLSAVFILLFLLFGTKEKKIIPGKIQLISEMLYNFIGKMINDTAGKKAKPYFPFIFSLFIFVLFCNMIGMLPYSFTVTSHIIVTLAFAMFIFIGVTILGFISTTIMNYFALIGATFIISMKTYQTNSWKQGWALAFIMVICTYLAPGNIIVIFQDHINKLLTDEFNIKSFNINYVLGVLFGFIVAISIILFEALLIKVFHTSIVDGIDKFVHIMHRLRILEKLI
mgnify:CR=1 FL=1